MNKWFSFDVVNKDSAEISIFDEIGAYGIDATKFKESFDLVKDKNNIHVYINSPGGDIMDGMAIYNMLSKHKEKVTVEIIGIAASIASIIALAGGKLVMDEGTYYMIHNPWTGLWGDAEELRKTADILDKIKSQIVSIYANKTGLEPEEIAEMMDAETWLTVDEAIEKGFADEARKAAKLAAKFDLKKKGFNNLPEAMRPKVDFENMDIRSFEKSLRDAGFSVQVSRTIASAGFKAAKKDEAETSGEFKAAIEAAIRTLRGETNE